MRGLVLAGVAVVAVCAASISFATTITVLNLDGAGEGFNDPTPVAPVGGNTGTTRGAQRLVAFQYAADIWADLVNSSIQIRVGAEFNPLPCNASSATLGQAGPNTVHRDFAGAPVAATWYPAALANALAAVDLDPGNDDIGAEFNSVYGAGCAFPRAFYYGLDGNPTVNTTDFVAVVLHELGHGLGFLSLVNDSTGAKFGGFDDVFMRDLEDHSIATLYPAMSNAQRVAAATDTGDLHWVGSAVVAASGSLTGGRHASGHVEMYAPATLQPGSSVSHWSVAVTPNELMEPTYTGPIHTPGLALELMDDIGWDTNICGDGLVDPNEGCDDNNATGGDGCSAVCEVEPCYSCAGGPSLCIPQTGPACTNGDPCVMGEICTAGTCGGGTTITTCTNGDGCCTAGCNSGNDDDCPVVPVPAITPPGQLVLAMLLALALWWVLVRRTVPARR